MKPKGTFVPVQAFSFRQRKGARLCGGSGVGSQAVSAFW